MKDTLKRNLELNLRAGKTFGHFLRILMLPLAYMTINSQKKKRKSLI